MNSLHLSLAPLNEPPETRGAKRLKKRFQFQVAHLTQFQLSDMIGYVLFSFQPCNTIFGSLRNLLSPIQDMLEKEFLSLAALHKFRKKRRRNAASPSIDRPRAKAGEESEARSITLLLLRRNQRLFCLEMYLSPSKTSQVNSMPAGNAFHHSKSRIYYKV